MVLDLYDNGYTNASGHGYYVYSFTYANLASTFKVTNTIPAYISFITPTFLSQIAYPPKFAWIFMNANSVTLYRQDDTNNATHYAQQTLANLTSNFSITAASDNCMIVL
jgi:hypothetical protein